MTRDVDALAKMFLLFTEQDFVEARSRSGSGSRGSSRFLLFTEQDFVEALHAIDAATEMLVPALHRAGLR